MFIINKYYKIYIGCEIHIKCNLQKIFSFQQLNIYDKAIPGVLPIFNKKIINFLFLINFVLKGNLFYFFLIERKLYFYYDLPKNYQLTQNNYQSIFNIIIKNKCLKNIIVKKIHFEEDAASSKTYNNLKIINYDRSGNTLFEIVTEPIFNDFNCLLYFLKKIKKIFYKNNISNTNLHLGEMRFDINLSLLNKINLKKTKKIEIKNLNSFISIKNSLFYEIYRKIINLEKNKKFVSQTRNYNGYYTNILRKKCFASYYNYHIDYDFGYFINFDYEIYYNKKLKIKKIFLIFKKFPKKNYIIMSKYLKINKNLYFIKNQYFNNFLFFYNFLKIIKKNIIKIYYFLCKKKLYFKIKYLLFNF
ncbi:hypothetical protein [Candidatus Carsonella ruddii]|uniref:hypothetical protein n=1 Tax=Carsonella ruddii TaxID=114186 RepID=UPI003D8125C0